jgi:uncharacterized damage-inducible protein DinB
MIKDDIQLLFEYDRWANNRVLHAASALRAEQFTRELGGSLRSVRDTLVHIIGGEWGWLTYWKEVAPGPAFLKDLWDRHDALFHPDEFPSITEVKSKWAEVEKEHIEFFKRPDQRILETNASDSHHTNELGEPDATSGKPFHLPSRASRTNDAAA